MLREFDYHGHRVQMTVLPEQGRWAYRIDDAEMHTSSDVRAAAGADALFAEAEKAARAHIDGAERRRGIRAERESRK